MAVNWKTNTKVPEVSFRDVNEWRRTARYHELVAAQAAEFKRKTQRFGYDLARFMIGGVK